MRFALILLAGASMALGGDVPDGFAVYSRGDAHKRELVKVALKPGMKSSVIRDGAKLICKRGPHGGDIQGQISFDGKWVAFARSRAGTPDTFGGNDYHAFDKWDIYIVRVDGKLPTEPILVDQGYWPSWGADSIHKEKTLFYSKHPDRAVHRARIDENGKVLEKKLHGIVPEKDYDGFMMAAPSGKFAAVRYHGEVCTFHFAGELAGRKIGTGRGCHPHILADGSWVVHAFRMAARSDGSKMLTSDDIGRYHYGTSPDMKWFITRTSGGVTDQNHGRDVWLYSLKKTSDEFGLKKETKITDDGSWVDIHTWDSFKGFDDTVVPPVGEVKLATVTAEGDLVFNWEDVLASNQIVDGKGKPIGTSMVVPKGTARFGRHGVMDIREGGWFDGSENAEQILGAAKESKKISIEMLVAPKNPEQKGTLFASSELSIRQDGKKLFLAIGNEEHPAGELYDGANFVSVRVLLSGAMHRDSPLKTGRFFVSVMCDEGEDFGFVHGATKHETWSASESEMRFGDKVWSGEVSCVKIFSEFRSLNEFQLSTRAIRKAFLAQPKAEQKTVKAKLIELTPVPKPADIHPYKRSLVTHLYELENGTTIQVAHWAILDSKVRPEIAKLKKGDTITLTIEPMENQVQLVDREKIDQSLSDFESDVFFSLD